MDMELMQSIIDIVFKGLLLYLAPFLFLLMVILFAEQLIGLINFSIGGNSTGRRTRY
jgi:hypothetical protein